MLSKLKVLLGGADPNYPKPPLEEGEDVIREGVAARVKGFFGGAWGPLILTNRRVIWYQAGHTWPFKRISGELNLSDIASVDKGSILDFVFGGRRIRLRLRDGKIEKLYEGDGKLDEWIETLRRVIIQSDDRSVE